MKTLTLTIILISVIFSSNAQIMKPLTDEEIKLHRLSISSAPSGNFYPRQYLAIPGDELRAHLRRTKDLKWAFCEALVNTVVRTLTRDLRQNRGKPQTKTVVWEAERGTFIFSYKAAIKNSVIVREECALKFPGIKAVQTLNGKMRWPPDISTGQLAKILKLLKKSDIIVAKVHAGVKMDADKSKATYLIEYLGLTANTTVYQLCTDANPDSQVKIVLR